MRRVVLKSIDTQGRSARPLAGEVVIIGVDLARSKWVYACRWAHKEQRSLSTPGQLSHLQALVREYQSYGCRVQVVYEACGFGYEIAWWMQEQDLEVVVVPPSEVEKAPGSRVKTDGHDASGLALRHERGMLKAVHIPSRECHKVRQLSRTYGAVMCDRKRQQARLRMLLQEHGHTPPPPKAGWKALVEWVSAQELSPELAACIAELLKQRESAARSATVLKRCLLAIAAAPQYKPLVRALTAQSGIGAFTAIRFILEVDDIHRFPTADSIGHFYGLTPQEHSTGETVRRGRIRKCGPAFIRAWIVQCAWAARSARGGDAELRAFYERLYPRTGKKRAIVAVARKLALRLRARWLAYERSLAEAA